MGANAAIFSALYGLLIRPLPVKEPHRLVLLYETYTWGGPQPQPYASYPNFEAWRAGSEDIFESMAAFSSRDFDLVERGVAESVHAEVVTANFFDLLGIGPAVGRAFERREVGPVCLVSDRLWKRRWNADPELLGKTIRLEDIYATVVGILPQGFERWHGTADIWISMASAPSLFREEELTSRRYVTLTVLARLRSGVTLEAARATMERLNRQIILEDPEADNGIALVGLREHLVDPGARRAVLLLMASVLFVLLVACANVSNLLLSLATARQKELAIRAALGASLSRLVRQSTFEGLLLSLFAGTLGLLMAWMSTRLLAVHRPPSLEPFEIDMGGWVLTFQLAMILATTLLVSWGATFEVTRRRRNLARSIAGTSFAGGFLSPRPTREWLGAAFIVSQISLSLVLLVGTGLMLESLARLGSVPMVREPANLLQVLLSLPQERYPFSDLRRQQVYRQELLKAVSSLPGVGAVGYATSVPMPSGGGGRRSIWLDDGRRLLNGDPATRSSAPGWHAVSPGHFLMLGAPLVRGRDFTESDAPDSPPLAIVNETMARTLWSDDPLGKRIRFGSREPWHEVIGIVGDIPYGSPRNPVKPEAYVPLNQQPTSTFWLLLRTRNDAARLYEPLIERIREFDPLVPILKRQTTAEALDVSLSQTRYIAFALTAFGALTLVLSAAGVFAVTAHSVARRTFEFGIRMALGARALDIWALVLRKVLVLALAGSALGTAGALVLTRFLESFLYEVERDDPTVVLLAIVFLLGCCLSAVFVPARRATSLDPSVSLRVD
jgi:putative ABC transport system permease protein